MKDIRSSTARESFIVTLIEETPGIKPREVMAIASGLLNAGRSYGRLQTTRCNRGLTVGEERRETRLELKIAALTAQLGNGFLALLSGDPRGHTVKIRVPSGRSDDFGESGICVPTS